MSDKVLVIGDGYVATFFQDFPEKYTVVPKTVFEQNDKWINILGDYDIVVNAYDITNSSLRHMMFENYYFVLSLYENCEKYNKKLVHISTGDFYAKTLQWKDNTEELKRLNISTDYLLTKRVVERFLENTNSLILRIKNPFDGRNHPDNWLIKALSRKKVSNFVDTYTYLPDLKNVIEILTKENLHGIFNCVQEDCASDLSYLHHTLDLPKYSHLDCHFEEHEHIYSEINENDFFADVNSSKLKKYFITSPMVSSVIISWEKLKPTIDKNLYEGKFE